MSIVLGNKGRLDSCAAFLALDGGSWLVNLFTNVYTPVPGSTAGSFTAPTYTGYAAQATGGWGTPAIDGLGNATSAGSGTLTFEPTGSSSLPQTIEGWWVEDGSGNFLFGDNLPAPFTFNSTADKLILTPSFSVGALC